MDNLKEIYANWDKKAKAAVKNAAETATKNAEIKKEIVEAGNLETAGSAGELSPAEQKRQLVKKGYKASARERDNIVTELVKRSMSKQ